MSMMLDNCCSKSNVKDHIQADVIVLGRSLPGIVTAHKLKKKFGDTMDIVVLDLAGPARAVSRQNVAFQMLDDQSDDESTDSPCEDRTQQLLNNVAKQYIGKYAQDFQIPLPDAILNPERSSDSLTKLFEYNDGYAVPCFQEYHNFSFLNFLERFELKQYQALMDHRVSELFLTAEINETADRSDLLYYDSTLMEKDICGYLMFHTSREVMRLVVGLVCGAPAASVSLLFYLHQCYRSGGTRNHLDGANTRLREKLLGYCRKHVSCKLQNSIADITLCAKPIKEIRSYSPEQVILETKKGESNYICSQLAMALRPDELLDIQVEAQLLSLAEVELMRVMTPGRVKKFVVRYDENFWRREGYSGDILSVRGPILWAMERPRLSATGSQERYPALVGFLKGDREDSRKAVLAQLQKLFGEEAASPVDYREILIDDLFVPCCGNYVAVQEMVSARSGCRLNWSALDVFADGDMAAALQAGHTAYLNLLRALRPQAQSYDDVAITLVPTSLTKSSFGGWLHRLNYIGSIRLAIYSSALYLGVWTVRKYILPLVRK